MRQVSFLGFHTLAANAQRGQSTFFEGMRHMVARIRRRRNHTPYFAAKLGARLDKIIGRSRGNSPDLGMWKERD